MPLRLVRGGLLAGVAFGLFIVGGLWDVRLLPFAFAAAAAIALPPVRHFVERATHYREVTPYSALASAAQQEALPGLARALARGTGARRAAVWLAVGERLVATTDDGTSDDAENLGVLLARPGLGHVVPVLDGTSLRAVLTIDKPELPVTPGDRVLMQDVANGAALLLRTVALNASLTERVRRADLLAEELRASRQRLARAREVERRRLLTELSRATAGRLVALREHVAAARGEITGLGTPKATPAVSTPETPSVSVGPADLVKARAALVRARAEVDELLDRFRVIARGVYPAVLRSQGPGAALEELAADLRRSVRLGGDLDVRVAWEIESAAYQVTAAALDVLAAQPSDSEIEVRLAHRDGRIHLVIEDPSAPVDAAQIRTALVDDIERLAALGGNVECSDGELLRLRAWLPDRLDALLEADPEP